MTTTPYTLASITAPRRTTHRVTQARVVRSEWTKLRSLRSTWYSLLIAILLMVILAVAGGAIAASQWHSMTSSEKASYDALRTSLLGLQFAQLAVGVLGVLALTGEYATGMIRSTFSAVPKRLPVLWGKATSLGATVFVVMLPAMAAAVVVSRTILTGHTWHGHDIASVLGSGTAVRGVVGASLYLTLVTVFGTGLAGILRSTAASIAALTGILFVLPGVVTLLLPSSWQDAVSAYLPSNAGQAIINAHQTSATLAPWTGLLVFACYAGTTLIVAASLLRHRDA
jgi:hypothetical protein